MAEPEREFATQVVQRLRSAGYEAVWAGGCVRDLLLGIAPHDFDVATAATPQQVQELFGKRKTIPVGVSFGVIIVRGDAPNQGQVEVATFRSDGSYLDGRRPSSVQFSSPQEDAQRRDFTINGMFYDPVSEEVIDYVGGEHDLEKQLLRAIGNPQHRFEEDKLRMLRAIRFAARFDLQIEDETLAAIKRNSADIEVVSKERIAAELCKTLQTAKPCFALRMLSDTQLLGGILPELAEHWAAIGDESLQLLEAVTTEDWRVRLAACLWPLHQQRGALPTGRLRELLKLSNDDEDAIEFALNSQQILSQANSLPWSKTQPLFIQRFVNPALNLLSARVAAGQVEQEVDAWIKERIGLSPDELNPAPFINGGDLAKLGLTPGPQFKQLLNEVREMQLDSKLHTRDEALRWIKSRSKP